VTISYGDGRQLLSGLGVEESVNKNRIHEHEQCREMIAKKAA